MEYIEVNKISSLPNRTYGGKGKIKILEKSIKRLGLINPLTVEEQEGGYLLIAGGRHPEAVRNLGWETVPATVIKSGHGEEITLAENVNREDMHPLDEAEIFSSMLKAGAKLRELATIYNRSISGIYQRSQLVNLIEPLKAMFREGTMDLSSAAMIAVLKSDLQQQFYEEVKDTGNVWGGAAHRFISKVQNRPIRFFDTCGKCKKRTHCTDPDLFPEYNHLDDVCLDDDCYRNTWIRLLGREIKKAEEATGLELRHIY
jgi:ParB/RepB/Spo0J family partition protein